MRSRTRLKLAAGGVLLAGLLLACAQAPEELPQAEADWKDKAAKYGVSNLVNARSLVAKFCLRGGPYDASPATTSGPFGFARVDAMGLKQDDAAGVVVSDIATGEEGWWRIVFNLRSADSYDFFINPRSRVATCGAAGLEKLRAAFRPDHATLQGDELAAQVYGLGRDGFVQDVSDQPDEVVCGLAVLQPYGIWETNSGYRAYVEEAQRRGYTPESCAVLTAG